jgi:UDP-N-acetyl-2-amino-2-deoxyglucuronate dehydrogenase
MPSFGLIGAAGFVAPRHMQAIRAIGGEVKAAFDLHDSVGVIDEYFPDAGFFVEFERFERHLEALRRRGEKLDWISVCSPNHLHDAHCRFSLRADADVICEKPLVLDPRDLDGLAALEATTGRRIFTLLQLRLHPGIATMKARLAARAGKPLRVELTHIASRGPWYHSSWKGKEEMSGGVATNIGIHLFDALIHVFGSPTVSIVHLRDPSRAAGFLTFEGAAIRWFVSVDRKDLPPEAKGRSTFRAIAIDDEAVDFTDGFADLHSRSYEEIMAGRGYGLAAARPAIELTAAIRTARIEPHRGERHPLLAKFLPTSPRMPKARIETAGSETVDRASERDVKSVA